MRFELAYGSSEDITFHLLVGDTFGVARQHLVDDGLKWEWPDALVCVNSPSRAGVGGYKTSTWEALTPQAELWLLANIPPEANIPTEAKILER